MHRSRRLVMVTCWNEKGFGFGSEMKMKNEPWQHTFVCCVFPSHTRWGTEKVPLSQRRAPSSFLGWEKGNLSSGGKENTILIVVSLLTFLGCASAEALQRRHRCIALCDWILAPLAADVCFRVIVRPHW
jgi:hypothetical protein